MKHTRIAIKRAILGSIALGLVLSLLVAGNAMAHASLVSSEPNDGAKLDAPPAKITLVFNEELGEQESSFTVTDAAGKQVGAGKLDLNDLDRKTLTGTLDAGAGDGVYTVNWVGYTPDDKETKEGSISFTVGAAQAQPTAAPAATARPTSAGAPTAQPTVAPTAASAAGGSPSTLPRTGEVDALSAGLLTLAALIVLAGGLVLRRSKRRT
jgi:copper resistance protein C